MGSLLAATSNCEKPRFARPRRVTCARLKRLASTADVGCPQNSFKVAFRSQTRRLQNTACPSFCTSSRMDGYQPDSRLRKRFSKIELFDPATNSFLRKTRQFPLPAYSKNASIQNWRVQQTGLAHSSGKLPQCLLTGRQRGEACLTESSRHSTSQDIGKEHATLGHLLCGRGQLWRHWHVLATRSTVGR